MMDAVNKLIWALVNPFLVGAVGLLVGYLAFVLKRRRMAGVVLTVSLLWGWVWSSGFCFKRVRVGWEVFHGYPQRVEEFPTADAIVDLGGGVGGDVEKGIYPDIHASADREWQSARLWKAGKAPVVIPSGFQAEKYSAPLLLDLGVPKEAIVLENHALNTEENAKRIAEMGYRKVLLVTSAWHMRRSVLMFRKYAPQVEVVPAATDYEGYVGTRCGISWRDFVPSVEAYYMNSQLFHELLGYYGYKWFRK